MHSVNGIGLAATQIGVAKQVAVIDISPEKNEPLVIVNPAIQILDPSKTEDYDEGCLSVPGFFEKISRPSDIKLSYQDLNGKKQEIKPEGLLTKVVQHELDHLNGRKEVEDTRWPSGIFDLFPTCLLYTSPSPRDGLLSRMPSSA